MLVRFPALAAAFLFMLVLAGTPVRAEEIKVIGAFDNWTAYETSQAGKKLCYMASEPKKSEGKYKKRGRIYAMVSHRPSTKVTNVVSLHAGYKYKEGSTVEVTIGGHKFTLFTHGDTAWASEPADDRALVKAMRGGSKMVVRGVSWRGTKTKDTYSLLGFTAAHRGIGKACGVK
ncbi:MAG: invasion associated locus B family protein [Alphaproteobacteria bacterium]